MSQDMGDSTAAIVWGMPVKLMELLRSLHAFRKAAPAIHTLRLCNQSGKTENAGITKLPKELIGVIEAELLALHRQRKAKDPLRWTRKYHCYERTCCANEHRHGYYMPSPKDGSDEDGSYYSLDDSDDEMYDGDWEVCYENRYGWQSDLLEHMDDEGNNDILRKHFGLDTFIMHEVLDASTAGYLKRNDELYAYGNQPEKATICYLVLPPRTAQWETRCDEESKNSGYYHGESASSVLVDPNSLVLSEEHQRRFARAMLQLTLEPSVHPSQLKQEMSATSTIGASSSPKKTPSPAYNKDSSEEEKAARDSVIRKRISSLEQSQWPKLMLLTSQTYSAY